MVSTKFKCSRVPTKISSCCISYNVGRGHPVAQLVEALRYKAEGRGFDNRWCHRNFSLTKSFQPHYGPGVDSVSNRNEYQKYFLGGKGSRCVGLITLPPSRADCLEILEPQPPGIPTACRVVYRCHMYVTQWVNKAIFGSVPNQQTHKLLK